LSEDAANARDVAVLSEDAANARDVAVLSDVDAVTGEESLDVEDVTVVVTSEEEDATEGGLPKRPTEGKEEDIEQCRVYSTCSRK